MNILESKCERRVPGKTENYKTTGRSNMFTDFMRHVRKNLG